MISRKTLITAAVATVLAATPIAIGIGTGKLALLGRNLEKPEIHHHEWALWGDPTANSDRYVQFRHCTNCGLSEMRFVQTVK